MCKIFRQKGSMLNLINRGKPNAYKELFLSKSIYFKKFERICDITTMQTKKYNKVWEKSIEHNYRIKQFERLLTSCAWKQEQNSPQNKIY